MNFRQLLRATKHIHVLSYISLTNLKLLISYYFNNYFCKKFGTIFDFKTMYNKTIIMKKILLSVAVLIVTAFYANAQSFTLSMDGELLGDTITVTPDSTSAPEIEFKAIFNNLTGNGANIKVVRNEVSMVDSTSSYFCWGACYPPHIDTSGMSMFIPAGGSSADGDFSAHYEIHNAIGISVIEYTFYNMDNPDENVKIVVQFDTSPSAIDENILSNMNISDIYPNPADNFVNINYDMPVEVHEASVKIVNILGSVVKEERINHRSNTMRMNISDLKGGIYFYSIFVNGEMHSTKKLLVK